MECDNAIYEEVQEVDVEVLKAKLKQNDSYKCVNNASAKSEGLKPGSKKIVVVLGLTFATLVLLLGAVAAIVVYTLMEESMLKSEIASSKLESAQMNFSFQVKDLKATIQHLQDEFNYASNQQYFTIQDLSNSTAEMVATLEARMIQEAQQMSSAISTLQQQSAHNDSTLDTRLTAVVNSFSTAHQLLFVLNSILGKYSAYPAPTCDALPSSFPAGNYYILSSTGSAVRQYCPSITTRCGQTGRWRSVANLDMTRLYSRCPSELILHRNFSKTLCIRHSNPAGCSSVQRPTNTPYRSVCGMVRAYQFGQPEAFNGLSSIDTHYVDGVSITHGSPRQHIWSFAATYNSSSARRGCPCMGGSNVRPSFVGNDYFCDTGSYYGSGPVFYDGNPLWDGAGCDGPSNTCCSFNTPPWFYKELSQYTHDTIELRICSNQNRNNEDTFLEAFAIYVK